MTPEAERMDFIIARLGEIRKLLIDNQPVRAFIRNCSLEDWANQVKLSGEKK